MLLRYLFSILFLCASASLVTGATIQQREPVDYYDPSVGGGNMYADALYGLEPLNVIISGRSDPRVLTDHGFLHYGRALGFSRECLNIHLGDAQLANLGDGHGSTNETYELRLNFYIDYIGTCIESMVGGNHLRMWRQDGPEANSGALFLAVSKERDARYNHAIAKDGYNAGRDHFVSRALGIMSYNGVRYKTEATDVYGLMPVGRAAVNHRVPTDGMVKLLTITIV